MFITKADRENIKEYAEKCNLLFRHFENRFLTEDEEADLESEINAIGRLLADSYMDNVGYELKSPEGKEYLQWQKKSVKVK